MQNIAAKVLLFFHICNLFAQKYTNRATRHSHEWLLIGYFSPFCWVGEQKRAKKEVLLSLF